MNIDILPLISFVIITTFTPGPNNISSASIGIMHGYRKSINFIFGVASGFFVVMIACAYLSNTLLSIIPVSEKYLRWLGAFYILWLAVGILRSGNSFTKTDTAPKAFTKGFVLQLFNPKVIVYGLTLYSTFLSPISQRMDLLSMFAAIFALTAFASTSTWALCGAAIKTRLSNDSFRKNINMVLSLLLIYTAVDLSGIMSEINRPRVPPRSIGLFFRTSKANVSAKAFSLSRNSSFNSWPRLNFPPETKNQAQTLYKKSGGGVFLFDKG